MSRFSRTLTQRWMKVGTEFLPFADAASAELPLGRLLRLSLFQVSVGMAMVLLIGTLNRVLIVELGVPAWLVSLMVGLPLVFAPFRAFIGFRSDNHRSALGWRRVPYIWMGTLLQFGGLAIMPFALLILSGDTHGPIWIGQFASAFAFLLVGAGLQTTQTAGLALATDLAPEEVRPRVIALMYVMLLVGMVARAWRSAGCSPISARLRLIQVVQGAAMVTMALESRRALEAGSAQRARTTIAKPPAKFRDSWREFTRHSRAVRFLVTVGLGTAAFNMQDIVLEPYGGEILHLPVGATTALTAMLAGGMLARLLARRSIPGTWRRSLSHRRVRRGHRSVRLCAASSSPRRWIRRCCSAWACCSIGFGGGFFSVGTLAGAMARERNGESGLALGAWGAVQATSAGLAIALGRRDARRDHEPRHARLARSGAEQRLDRLRRGLSDRDFVAVRHAGGDRAAGAVRDRSLSRVAGLRIGGISTQ